MMAKEESMEIDQTMRDKRLAMFKIIKEFRFEIVDNFGMDFGINFDFREFCKATFEKMFEEEGKMSNRNTEDFDKFFKIDRCWACKKGTLRVIKEQLLTDYETMTASLIDVYGCSNCSDTFIKQKDGNFKRWNL